VSGFIPLPDLIGIKFMNKPPFFIVGVGRSGTTLLRRMLSAHPNITIPPETSFVHRCIRKFGSTLNQQQVQELLSYVESKGGLRDFDVTIEQWRSRIPSELSELSIGSVLSIPFELYAEKRNKHHWGDKTPKHIRRVVALAQTFPGAKFIHLVRDGRDVALSFMAVAFGPNDIDKAAWRWRRTIRKANLAEKQIGAENFLTVRYEDLVEHPEQKLQEICNFLGEQYYQEMITAGNLTDIGEHWKGFELVHSSPTKSRVGRWRQEMKDQDRAWFDAVNYSYLKQYDYEVGSISIAKYIKASILSLIRV
jgi:hypothetical protein